MALWQTSVVVRCLSARVVSRNARPTAASTGIQSLRVASLTTGKAFAKYPFGARTTIEEKRKRTVLARSWKRADLLYNLNWKSILLVFNNYFGVIFPSFILMFYVRFVETI